MRAAFTLLEVLVGITIVLLLAMLAMAGIQHAHERGRATTCLSNLRALVAANLSYAGDHDGEYVPAQSEDNLTRWHGVRGGIEAEFDPAKGPLAPYLGREARVKACPCLKDVLGGSDSFEDGSGGYGYNAAYIGGTPLDAFTPCRTSLVERPARTVMFSDSAFPRANGLQEYAYSEPWVVEYPVGRFRGKLSASVHFRHLGRANVGWCDGHVSTEEPSRIDGKNSYGGDAAKWKIGWFGPDEENGYWRP